MQSMQNPQYEKIIRRPKNLSIFHLEMATQVSRTMSIANRRPREQTSPFDVTETENGKVI